LHQPVRRTDPKQGPPRTHHSHPEATERRKEVQSHDAMASPPPDQDHVHAPDQTHQEHIALIKQSLMDLAEKGFFGEDFYVNAEGLVAARETEEDEDIIEEHHLQTYRIPAYIPLPRGRRQIYDPDLKYITREARSHLTAILKSVEHLVRKPILIEKLATMLAQPRGIIRRDLKKVFEEHLMLPLSCWHLMHNTKDFDRASAAKSEGQYIWENVIGPARVLLGITRTVRFLPSIKAHKWRVPILQALAELHGATRPADRSLQTALNMMDEACPASALTNGLSDHQDTLLWREARPQLLKNSHFDWPTRLEFFAEEHLGMGCVFWDAFNAGVENILEHSSPYDEESDPDDLGHQLASWVDDD
ncbi:hypothetical protein F5X68DRAFT_238178, partial [Plectosphaerella plurivora]